MTCPRKYLSKGSKSPSPGSEKSPCKYSTRGAKSQPRFSHSSDQGKITKQVLPQGIFFVIQKVKATHIPPFNQWEIFPAKEIPGFALRFKSCGFLAPHTHNFAFPIYVCMTKNKLSKSTQLCMVIDSQEELRSIR